jgi:two-component system, chemotaxis family, CheB/CheR fusion protein
VLGKESKNRKRITVVGIGASAGGIEALREFFDAVPPDLGLAYVVNLAPDHNSELPAILGRRTTMPVVEVSDERLELEPDHVYVISPDHKLELSDTTIAATPFDSPQARRTAIDVFFRSLAESCDDGFAIVLSGGGSDGAVGAKAVKEAGGSVLVQDPREATHEGMPRAVIAAEIADLVLPVRELAARLGEFARHKEKLAPLMPPYTGEVCIDENDELVLKRIFDLVRLRTNHDFSRYKRATILRRLARRMQLNHRTSLEHYLVLLKDHPEEVQALFDDLLISVTSFFRDPAAWEALRKQVIAPLVEHIQPNRTIRAWVPGCATGEEAYTLAILFREEISRRDTPCELVIFGSDVDQGALATARDGVYPAAIAADVTEARLARYFRAEGEQYRISSEIRDSVVFAAHGVLRDPPFSKLHLISCRNLLIYLGRELQQQLQSILRYALRDDGYLFIGVSETADGELFEPIDKQHRLFRARTRVPATAMRLPQLPAAPPMPAIIERGRERGMRSRRLAAEAHVEILEELAPPSVLVDEHWTVEHLSATAGRYLQPRGGPPTQVVTELVRAELIDELRSALHRAFELRESCLSAFVPVRFNGSPQLVAVLVQPRPREEGREPHVLVTFLEAGNAEPRENGEGAQNNDSIVLGLRDKLRLAEQRLETMRQEHDTELHAVVEELENAHQELQAVNEELVSLNDENRYRVESLAQLSNDLQNLLESAGLATLLVDCSLNVVRFTPLAADIFSLRGSDIGRPLGDLHHRLRYGNLVADVGRVIEALTDLELEVESDDGRWFLMRVQPYHSALRGLDGVVLLLIDISARKRAELALQEANRRKDEFLSVLAHELRNPLAPIGAGIEVLRSRPDNATVVRQVSATMARQTHQLVRLVDDLLEVARISSGKLTLHTGQVEIAEVVRDAVAAVRPFVDSLEHQLTITAPDQPLIVEGDAMRLTQVVGNLLHNAVHYTPARGQIALDVRRTGDQALISVRDNGLGISPQSLPHLFDMFYQAGNQGEGTNAGLGIGLTLAKTLVEMHSGTISAESAGPNQGSTFTVCLPLAPGVSRSAPEASGELNAAADKQRVLIVDDNAEAAEMLRLLMATIGSGEVQTAFSGVEALRVGAQLRPNVVLLDLAMPGMDGYEVARRMRDESWGRDALLVALTGYGQDQHRRRSKAAGFDRHMTKPADPAALRAVLNDAGARV